MTLGYGFDEQGRLAGCVSFSESMERAEPSQGGAEVVA